MKDKFPNKQIKRQLSWEGHPTHQPAKSLRHNEKEKKAPPNIFFFFTLRDLFRFLLALHCPSRLSAFFFSCFFLLETIF